MRQPVLTGIRVTHLATHLRENISHLNTCTNSLRSRMKKNLFVNPRKKHMNVRHVY